MMFAVNDMLAQLESPVRKPPREGRTVVSGGFRERRVSIEYMWGSMPCTTEVILKEMMPVKGIIFKYAPHADNSGRDELHEMPLISNSIAITSITDVYGCTIYENKLARHFFRNGTLDDTDLRILRMAKFGSETAATPLMRRDEPSSGLYRCQKA
jgi:hypothetical protein